MPSRLLENGMICMQRRANRQALISGGGLQVRVAKGSAIEELSIGYAVERTASGHGKVIKRGTLMQLIQKVEKYLLETVLNGEGQVHVALCDFSVKAPRLAK